MKRLAGFLCVFFAACSHEPDAPVATNAAPAVDFVTARITPFVETVAATGRFGSQGGAPAQLAFAEGGIVASVSVRLGDRVTAGQVLAQLDRAKLALGAAQAAADVGVAAAQQREAEVDRTSAKIRLDERALARAKSLYAAGVAPRKDIEAADAQLAGDRADETARNAGIVSSAAQVTSARTRVALANRDLDQATLHSPVDGVVAGVLHRTGEAVDQSTPILSIAPSGGNDLVLLVTTADLARVRPGDLVHFELAGTDTKGTGTVSGIAPVIDPQAQSGNVIVRVHEAGQVAGSVATATIDVATIDGIALPEDAIVQDPETGKTLVFIARKQANASRFEQREVHVLHRGSGRVLIASGVRPGDRVAARGAFALLAPAGE